MREVAQGLIADPRAFAITATQQMRVIDPPLVVARRGNYVCCACLLGHTCQHLSRIVSNHLFTENTQPHSKKHE